MGLFDLPAPGLSWLDGSVLAALPAPLRLVLWAVAAAVLSMEAYRLLSPQAKVAAMRRDLAQAQARLTAYDGSFDGAWPLIQRMLGLALGRVGLVLPATLVATVPLVMLLVWLDGAYAHRFPHASEPVSVTAPGDFQGHWVEGGGAPQALIADRDGATVAMVTVAAPIPVLHKPRWWNALIANPAGYLPADAPVDHITLALPRREVLAVGPAWLRRWEIMFFPALIIAAFAYKAARRIE